MTVEEFKAAVVARGYSEEVATDWLKINKMEKELGVEQPETMEEFISGLGYWHEYSAE